MRLKGIDPYFLNMEKIIILPQFPLVSASIEEGYFLVKLEIAIFKDFDVSSTVT